MANKFGKIVQVIGPVLDVEFEAGSLPEIYNALRIHADTRESGTIDIVAEVARHLGENRVRAVAMKPTDGIQRGMKAEDLGQPAFGFFSRGTGRVWVLIAMRRPSVVRL